MRDLPSCFGENAVQVADFSSSSTSRVSQNLVICVYECRIFGLSCFVTITWSKNLMGQGFSIGISDSTNQCMCKADVKSWLLSNRKGTKTLEAYSSKIVIYWDFSSVKHGHGPEPLEGFYLAILFKQKLVLLIGDMNKEALKKTNATNISSSAVLISKREHIFGKKVFNSKVRFCNQGKLHDLMIATDDISLVMIVDKKIVMKVNQLKWNFRGNHTILVDDIAVEVFWDVHNWFFSATLGHAVFMFKTESSVDKTRARQPLLDDFGKVQSSCSQRFNESQSQDFGFSLVLFAWRAE